MIKENDIYLGMEVKAAKTPFNLWGRGREREREREFVCVGAVLYLVPELCSRSPFTISEIRVGLNY